VIVQLLKGGKVVEEFANGDIVRLKSGGPPMTITGYNNNTGKVICQWILMQPEPRIGLHEFRLETLTKRPEDQIK
jgi:uncharacterized protein YodC (DUF2158 family)